MTDQRTLVRLRLRPKRRRQGRWKRFKAWLSKGIDAIWSKQTRTRPFNDVLGTAAEAGRALLDAEILKTDNLRMDIEGKLAAIRKSDAETQGLLAQAELHRAMAAKTTVETQMLTNDLDQKLLERGISKLAELSAAQVTLTVLMSDNNEIAGLLIQKQGEALMRATGKNAAELVKRLRRECPQLFTPESDQ